MALPALLSGGARALGTGSKLARTANVGRKLLGTKTNKKGPGRNSPEYENESGGRSQLIVRPSTALIPSTQTSRVGPVDVKVTPVTGKSTLEEDVKYIKDKTIEIDKLLKGSFTQRKKEEAALRKERAAARRKGKEERFEKGGRRGMLGKATDKAKKPFSSIWEGIKNYLTAVLLGFLAVRLAPLLPKLLDFAKLIAPAIEFVLDAAGFLLNGLVTFIDWGYKAYDATLGFIKTLGGENAVKAFEKFSDVFNKVMNLALILAMVGAAGGGLGGGRGAAGARPRPGTGGRPKVTTTGGRAAGRPDLRSPLRERPRVTTTGGGAAGRPDIRSPLRTRPTVTTGAGKAAAEFGEQGLKKAAGRFIRPLVKRLPIVGGLIDFGISVALGESLGRAAFKAIGATILGAIGTGFGGPIGAILGGLAGDYAGGKLYDIFFSGKKNVDNQSKVKRKAAGGYIDPMSTGDTVAQSYQVGGLTGILGGLTLPPIPKFSIPDLAKNTLGRAVGGIKSLFGIFGANTEKQVKDRSEPLIALANKVKDVPLIGGAMFAAVNLALGNKTDTNVYRAIAGQLTNFSNLNAFGKVSSSLGKLNLVRMESGGQIASTNVTLTPEDNIIAVNNISAYLKNQFSDLKLDTLLEEETEKQDGTQPSPDLGPPGAPGIPGIPSGGSGTAEQRAMLDAISFAEGTRKSYGTVFGGKVIPELAKGEMTVGQVLEMQRTGRFKGIQYIPKNRYNSDATGRYQFMSYTLKEEIQKQGVSRDAKFTPTLQDKLILGRISRMRGVTPELLKREGMSTRVMDKLAPEFASFPYSPKGNASYYGQPVKSPDSIRSAYNKALGTRREEIAKEQKQQKQGGLLGSVQRLFGGGEQTGGDVPKGSVLQWLHGNPNRKGYRSDHGGESNAHDHFSFRSRSAAVNAFKKLKASGYKPYEFEGFTKVGTHSPTGGHFAAVGAPPTYNDKTDGVAFDIPWSTYGTGPIGKRDYDLSYKAAKIVGAAQGGGVVPGGPKTLQQTMSYDKGRTKVVVQPMIVEKEVPMPMPMGGGTKVIVASGEVNSMADNLFAG
jgi:muramidase (phage lysozyme)